MPPHPGSRKRGHGVLITSIAVAVVILLAGIAGATFYVVEQVRPHEYEVKFFASGHESYVEVQYGFESVADAGDYSALKAADWDVGSGGHWGFDELELFSGQPRTAVINLVVDQSRSSGSGTISCGISVDGEVMARSEEFSVRDHDALQCSVEVG